MLGLKSVALAWGPRTDGDFFEDAHDALVEKGVLADVPVVVAVRILFDKVYILVH